MKAYKSVGCRFLDRIEDLATRRVSGKVIYLINGEERMVESRIISWECINKDEFLILENELKIRLDQIVELCGFPGPAFKAKT